jgi:hypothetical protein
MRSFNIYSSVRCGISGNGKEKLRHDGRKRIRGLQWQLFTETVNLINKDYGNPDADGTTVPVNRLNHADSSLT